MNDRTPILAANWKMYKTIEEMEDFFSSFLPMIKDTAGRQIVIAPSFVGLRDACRLTSGTRVEIAAQNMYFEEQGAFTGEISPLMIRSAGAGIVIIGHSERRHIFGEGHELISKKVKSGVDHRLHVILCIGETLEERDEDRTAEVLSRQLSSGLELVAAEDFKYISIAYEPVWAIGTGKTASVEQIQEAHAFVRQALAKRSGESVAEQTRILYGGSVKPGNVRQIMELEDVDGALVGGASLEPESFARIVKFEEN